MSAAATVDAASVAVLGTVSAAAFSAIAAGEMQLGNRRWLRWFDAAAIAAAITALLALVVEAWRTPVTTGTDQWGLAAAFGFWGFVVGVCLALRHLPTVWNEVGRTTAWRLFGTTLLTCVFAFTGCANGCGVGMLVMQ